MSKLLLTFYGDDFTGSTDALEQLANAGIRAALFITPPTKKQLARFKNLQAVGIAGMTRSLPLDKMEKKLRPAFLKLKKLGARHVHYKVCSTFDSSPTVGSIGRAMDVAAEIFRAPFIPLLVAAPSLGRYTIFGQHFARYGIGSAGAIHRLDRHPSISKHPITPMNEADLRLHLARQTKKKIALFDILKVALPAKEAGNALRQTLMEKPEVILFDALTAEHIARVGELLETMADKKSPLFSVGSSGIEAALAAAWNTKQPARKIAAPARQILVLSGSCSPVTGGQIAWALKHGFAEVRLRLPAFAADAPGELNRVGRAVNYYLEAGQSVIFHTTRSGADKKIPAQYKGKTAAWLGSVLGLVANLGPLYHKLVNRVCVAGGDTSSYAARAMGIKALEMIAPLTPGAPLCRAFAPGSPADGLEVVFKGGQVGAENYFQTVLKGNA